MKKTIYALLASTAMALSLLTGVQGASAAEPEPAATAAVATASDDVTIMGWPSGCADYQYYNGWLARCTKANGGSWLVFAVCQTEGGGPRFTRNPSVWQTTSNVPSIVSCPPGSFVVDGGIWTSNTP
ncbi:hypothetical protein ACFQS3_00875 [Glycomyces mayteni]|uniref:Secreted protein n=1 Tax=Glycomyces mayteni TaxID=543887 RepID=A0ABW2D4Z9_9ACTN|nr:hypothetical protein GCM10025732_44150 [Glycomyces mayteni]